jgi:hypothetical protein
MDDNNARRADEDMILTYLIKRDKTPERERLTPRMTARYIIDLLDQTRARRT